MTLTVDSVVAELGRPGPDRDHDRGLPGDRPRLADGGARQLRGHPLPAAARPRRALARRGRRRRASSPIALAHADDLARQAVAAPGRGDDPLGRARRGRGRARRRASWSTWCARRATRAREALARTPDQLPVLAQAGVVDSGGTGLCLLLDALCHVVAGDPLPEAPSVVVDRGARARRPRRHGDGAARPALRGDVLARGGRRARGRRSARSGPGSATRSSSSAVTASTTATSTPTTWAARSRRPSTRAARARSA